MIFPYYEKTSLECVFYLEGSKTYAMWTPIAALFCHVVTVHKMLGTFVLNRSDKGCGMSMLAVTSVL